MSDREMLLVLKSTLSESKRKIYENVHRQNQHLMDTEKGPALIYKAIKARHMQFCESFIERQLRYTRNWENFHRKAGMSAHQFEAAWEEIHADLEEVGLAVPAQEKYLGYLQRSVLRRPGFESIAEKESIVLRWKRIQPVQS